MSRPLSRRAVLRACAPLVAGATAGCLGSDPAPTTRTTEPTPSPSPNPVESETHEGVVVTTRPLAWRDGDPVVRGRARNGTSSIVLYVSLRVRLVDAAGDTRYARRIHVVNIAPQSTDPISTRLYDAPVDPAEIAGHRLEILFVHFE